MEMGKCTYGYSDLVRRAMGKKSIELMRKIKNEFKYGLREYDKDENGDDVYNINNPYILKENGDKVLLGAVYNGFSEEECDNIFDGIVEFAKYCFNKSHATAYAITAYQTAYLKVYYPVEFLTECMSINTTDESIMACIKEAKRLGIPILPVDVNKSISQYCIETLPDGRKGIRLGFSMVNGITNADAIVDARQTGEFKSIDDFFNRVPGNVLNRTKAPNIILAGGFDSIEPNRHKVYNYYFKTIRDEDGLPDKEYKKLEKAHEKAKKDSAEKKELKAKLSKTYGIKDENGFTDDIKYEYEQELMGLCVSGHPLDKYPYNPWSLIGFGQRTECYAIIKDLKVRQDKNKRAYAFFKVECLEDTRECVMWANDYAKYGNKLMNGKTLLLRGVKKADRSGNAQFVVNQAIARFAQNELNENTTAVNGIITNPTVLEDPTATLYNKPNTVQDLIYPRPDESDGIVFDYC